MHLPPPPSLSDRVAAVRALGFTEPQAHFIVTVLLHGGVCLRRQYAAFRGAELGKNASDLLERLVARRLARRTRSGTRHGYVYHLNNRALYRRIGEADNRHRRQAAPPVVARRLMLLDLALERRDVRWHTTEHEKVALLNARGVPFSALPQRTYPPSSTSPAAPTTRYFVNKLPIFTPSAANSPATFVCPVLLADAPELLTFRREHAPLFHLLPDARVLVVGPRDMANDAAVRNAYRRAGQATAPAPVFSPDEANWLHHIDAIVHAGQVATLSASDIRRYRELKARLTDNPQPTHTHEPRPDPPLDIHWLPFTYPV